MIRIAMAILCAAFLAGCTSGRYDVRVAAVADDHNPQWVAVKIDRTTGDTWVCGGDVSGRNVDHGAWEPIEDAPSVP